MIVSPYITQISVLTIVLACKIGIYFYANGLKNEYVGVKKC